MTSETSLTRPSTSTTAATTCSGTPRMVRYPQDTISHHQPTQHHYCGASCNAHSEFKGKWQQSKGLNLETAEAIIVALVSFYL